MPDKGDKRGPVIDRRGDRDQCGRRAEAGSGESGSGRSAAHARVTVRHDRRLRLRRQRLRSAFRATRICSSNTINWLAQQENLISIRAKPPNDRRLTMTARQSTVTFLTSLLVMPAMVFGTGRLHLVEETLTCAD